MSRYKRMLEHIFFERYATGVRSIPFVRSDLADAARDLGIDEPKNLGDVAYSFRYRMDIERIQQTAPEGMCWILRPKGRARYAFELAGQARIEPNDRLVTIKIPDATPEIVVIAARNDEQALLAKVRYNRLIDTFLGLTAYSLQSHLRTTTPETGQVEVDEIYVAVDQHGCHYVVPVEAKGRNDELGIVQTEQDLSVCRHRWGDYVARAVGVQFLSDEVIAMFELTLQDGEVRVVRERHYRLVPAAEITAEDRALYARLAQGASLPA